MRVSPRREASHIGHVLLLGRGAIEWVQVVCDGAIGLVNALTRPSLLQVTTLW